MILAPTTTVSLLVYNVDLPGDIIESQSYQSTSKRISEYNEAEAEASGPPTSN